MERRTEERPPALLVHSAARRNKPPADMRCACGEPNSPELQIYGIQGAEVTLLGRKAITPHEVSQSSS